MIRACAESSLLVKDNCMRDQMLSLQVDVTGYEYKGIT